MDDGLYRAPRDLMAKTARAAILVHSAVYTRQALIYKAMKLGAANADSCTRQRRKELSYPKEMPVKKASVI